MARANPNTGRITEPMWRFWLACDALEPADDELGGIYAFKPGHHSTRADNQANWPGNYSTVGDLNKLGPSDKSSALDWTFKSAKAGNYTKIKLYSSRLLKASQERDPRLRGLREWYGQADNDSGVEGWSFLHQAPASSDSSHLWHIHFSWWRAYVLIDAAFDGVLSVLRGESLQSYLARGGQLVGGDEVEEFVKLFQRGLKNGGYDPGAIDGDPGPKTEAAWTAMCKDAKRTPANGKDGKDGRDGKDGKDGVVVPGTVAVIQSVPTPS